MLHLGLYLAENEKIADKLADVDTGEILIEGSYWIRSYIDVLEKSCTEYTLQFI